MKLVPHQKRPLLIDLPQKERYQLVNLQHIFLYLMGQSLTPFFAYIKFCGSQELLYIYMW